MSRRVTDYDTGSRVHGTASAELVEQSEAASPTGAVPAYRDDAGVWQYVQPSQVEQTRRLGYEVQTVFVEE